MTKRDLERVAKAAAAATAARERRDDAIRAAHPRNTVRVIAKAAGLSPARVGQIIKKEGHDG
jgi:hypothetical protein